MIKITGMIKIEQTVAFNEKATVDIEDSGRAMIVHPEVLEGEDPNFFLRFQSWNDDVRGYQAVADGHPTLTSLMGKKFKITIEEISG